MLVITQCVEKLESTRQNDLALVVQTVDSAIYRINYYPAGYTKDFVNIYPLDSDLSGG